ncbi:hypothetical protein [Clostridium sp.]|jgi:hypothetical protein|uniref:hypothetical protein n=1 Tax=Clostridium sp. TaxID=1506 RepID=UPI0039F5AC76
MGFGKWLVGGVCTVGAVIAAPVVVPLAAGAVASSVAATAVGGAMATVGGAVGTAAGTVGLTSVATAAGTTAGATAVGTIATAGTVGAATTRSGAKKMLEAKEIVELAEGRYNKKKQEVDKEEKKANQGLEYLGKLKLEVWKSFDEFYCVITKIKNCKILEGKAKEESFKISKEELDNLRSLSFEASELLSAGAGSLATGALAGLAAYGGTMAVGTASTGAAIAGLSGAAATNATLAALGGGSIATGGLGMAGGTAVLGGVIAAPALAIGGIFLAIKGNNSIDKANEVSEKADKAIDQMNLSIKLIKDIDDTVDSVYTELKLLSDKFRINLDKLKSIVRKKQDFHCFNDYEVNITETCVLIVKILKKLTTTDLLIKKDGTQAVNHEQIDVVVNKAKLTNIELS